MLNLFELNCHPGWSLRAPNNPDLQYNCLLREGLIRLSHWMNLTGLFYAGMRVKGLISEWPQSLSIILPQVAADPPPPLPAPDCSLWSFIIHWVTLTLETVPTFVSQLHKTFL